MPAAISCPADKSFFAPASRYIIPPQSTSRSINQPNNSMPRLYCVMSIQKNSAASMPSMMSTAFGMSGMLRHTELTAPHTLRTMRHSHASSL